MSVEQAISEPKDEFPIGMRVLAVDDDPTCLLLLETLLRRCQYHVTTTSQAIVAVKMLRENKNKFDLVISEVHMPDMDGFKLLELVELEMDLPVIMLSANGDSKLVMKGITHGACDYLLKPVRIEELQKIWQHVIRRRKIDPKDRNNSDSLKNHHGSIEVGGMGNSDQNAKLNKKRKDQNEDEDAERDENGHDNEDLSTQKKPRVVWSVELHHKFVAAVNQLGIDKAVPTKILDLMNVEELTRENVASHLNKYKCYHKRLNGVANQQANMVAALDSTDASYLHMGSLNGLGNFNTLAGPGQFPNPASRSFSPGGMLGRLNTPAALGIHGLPSTGMIQLGHEQNSCSFVNDQAMTVEQVIREPKDQFPIGMRVLAIDDDPTCLLLLGTLLRRCQYHVTTTSQAIVAVKMLRENKNKFDLVISEVHMPDMDGFKLLELVELEMDLPVIMLSANGDSKLVMKGITHGACDYLLKPVRIEELQKIWQHVIRRRKIDPKDRNNSDSLKNHHGSIEVGGMGNSEQNAKLNKKRKDQNEDEDAERDENGHDNEDLSTQKKPRVVWSVELHHKFVAAVNQLGIDKAVPTKILDLMNVEKLTRENVASHLYKYKLYYKRLNGVANQQANMVAALDSADASYL